MIAGLLLCSGASCLGGGESILLWPGHDAPGVRHDQPEIVAERILPDGERVPTSYRWVSEPALTFFPEPGRTGPGPAVLVLPGGGYTQVVWEKEGVTIATWLNTLGFSAAVLKYRTGDPEKGPSEQVLKSALSDAQRAMQVMRHRADEWSLDPDCIGAMGFSAGAHLAMNLAITAPLDAPVAGVSMGQLGTRPSFLVVVYGGIVPSMERARGLPPVFIVHAIDDPKVPVKRAIDISGRLQEAGVPVETHIFAKGGHGFATRQNSPAFAWTMLFHSWAVGQGFLPELPLN